MVTSIRALDPWIRTGRPMNLVVRANTCPGAAPSSLLCTPRPRSASSDPWIQVPYAGDHWSGPSDLQKKVSRCILDLKLNVDSDYGAPRGPRASPGRVLSSQCRVVNVLEQGSSGPCALAARAGPLHRNPRSPRDQVGPWVVRSGEGRRPGLC